MYVNKEKEKECLTLLEVGTLQVKRDGTEVRYKDKIRKQYRLFRSGDKATKPYLAVNFSGWTVLVHRLVYLAHKGPIPEGLTLKHKDGNKENNRISNLELMTFKEQINHAYATGLNKVSDAARELSSARLKGDKNHQAAFTDEQALTLRRLYRDKKISKIEIMKQYGCNEKSVRNLIAGKTYSHLEVLQPKSSGNVGRPSAWTEQQQLEIVALHKQGISYNEIAIKLGGTKASVRHVARKFKDVD